MKKLILLTIILLTSISVSFGGYKYNDSYTDLYLDSNGWCANLEINFQVLNESDYDNKDDILSELCEPGCEEDCNWDDDEDCIECEWECKEFNYIEGATVKIYDGPLDSLPVLLETKTNKTGEFKYTFPSAQQHLIEIFPDRDKTPNYNDFHAVYDLYTCGHAQNTTIKEELEKTNPPEPKDVEIEYPLQGITLAVKQTTMNGTGAFIIDEKIAKPKPLNNTLRHFEITATDDDFSTIEMRMMIESQINPQTTTTLYWYNHESSEWESQIFRTQEDEIIFDATNLGIYAITQKTEQIEPQSALQQNELTSEQNQSNHQEEPPKEQTSQKSQTPLSKSSNKTIIIGTIIGLSLLLLVFIFAKKSKNKHQHYHEASNENRQDNRKEVLTSYEATYQQAKNYVQQYKEKYGKDSLYRALEKANVPKDIIDKVFLEEY